MNRALREFMENKAIEGKVESLEKMLRRVIEEVIPTPPVARMKVPTAARRKSTRSRDG
jgi:hypothetical protein